MASRTDRDYVLGTGDDELARLGFQHRVWSAQAFALWERAGFGPGQTIVDVGAGPGYAALDLARLVGAGGRVIAVDQSERFIDHLAAEKAARAIPQLETRLADVQAADAFAEGADGAYARWVLCFVADPEAVVAAVARSLRPGGVFAVQDYYRYTAIQLAPPSAAFRRGIEAVDRSWREPGGDPDIGLRLPAMMVRCGFEVREVRPLVRIARTGSELWQWPTTFFGNHLPMLVEKGLLSEDERRAFDADWAARSADPGAFFATPPMVDIVAVKRNE